MSPPNYIYDAKALISGSTVEDTTRFGNDVQPWKIRRDIQGLRGLAILYVLAFHLWPTALPRGYLGVDMFFVISGFLITTILWKHQSLSSDDILNFFSKRVRRIFPAYFLMIFCVLGFAFRILATQDYRLLRTDTRWAMGFAYNVLKYIQNKDYFADIANYEFLLHTWSLAVEIQFYLVAPLLVMVGRKGIFGKSVWVSLLVLSLVFNFSTTGPLQFSSLPSRLWQFLIGGFAYLCPFNKGIRNQSLILLSLLLLSPLMLFLPISDSPLRCIITVASAATIAFNDGHTKSYVLGNPALCFLGDISYSLYLAHWPIIIFTKYATSTDVLNWRDSIIAAELSIFLSVLSFKVVEKHFIKREIRNTLILLAIFCSASLILTFGKMGTSTTAVDTVKHLNSKSKPGEHHQTRFEKNCYTFRDVPYLPQNITEEMRSRAIEKNKKFLDDWGRGSHAQSINLTDPLYQKHFTSTGTKTEYMDYFKGNGSTSFVVYGNSYAQRAFYTILDAFGNRYKEGRLVATISCQPFETDRKDCSAFSKHSLELLEELKPDVIFFVYRPFWGTIAYIRDFTEDRAMRQMQSTIDRLSNVTKKIVLETMLPLHPQKFQTSLLLKQLETNESLKEIKLEFSEFLRYYKSSIQRMEMIKCRNCIRIYPHRIFCDDKVCRVFDPDNLISFFDGNTHYNDYARKCIGKLYRDTINELYAMGDLT